jgi:hypothetical protein
MTAEQKTVGGGMGTKPFEYMEHTCPKCKYSFCSCNDEDINNIIDDDVYEIGG